MFDRVNDLSDSLTGGSESEEVDPGELPGLLGDDEEPVYALANGGSIEHTRDGRTTTVEPSGDEQAYVIVTDERILYVLGDKPDEAEIEIDMADFTASHLKKGLLSSKLLIKTYEEEVLFAPDEGDLEATEAYVDSVASCWADMDAALRGARNEISEFEEACAAGKTGQNRFLDAKSKLSNARRCASREEEAPEGKMRARVDEAKVEIEHRYVEAWLDRTADRREALDTAVEEGRYDDACAVYVEATTAAEQARDALERVDDAPEGAADRLDDLESAVRAAGESFLDAADAECETALSAEEPDVAVASWEEAFHRYSAAIDAGWNGEAPVDPAAIEFQLTWVTSSLLDALGSQASMLEAEAEECDDDDRAQEYYDEAIEYVERAAEFAGEHPEHDPAAFEAEAERIEDAKLERSGWEFGNA
jgi:tetratricopeptide (TPR) repeat protein